jgi:hypothetical protein
MVVILPAKVHNHNHNSQSNINILIYKTKKTQNNYKGWKKNQRQAKQKHMMCFCIQFQLHDVVGGGDGKK